ncbi:hypothetical protein A1O7_06395 [Cladophialophora yegresii CBS 114405]|uniref:Uncharacterized protein n=1 Tax=Cladophialophora yegresii CBS 114405 TaxID=1182544 RepID=W9WKI0_9EURO|nr:uncharacterized protein A1O7_06395 [Cladophialophora yegresii CBS 114405]EXJ58964.1 hypothetical protein A1O7_06395 [Cladophialophora yegresii CBS 114405]
MTILPFLCTLALIAAPAAALPANAKTSPARISPLLDKRDTLTVELWQNPDCTGNLNVVKVGNVGECHAEAEFSAVSTFNVAQSFFNRGLKVIASQSGSCCNDGGIL